MDILFYSSGVLFNMRMKTVLMKSNLGWIRWAVWGCLLGGVLWGAEPGDLPKPVSRAERQIEGWTVLVDDRLIAPENEALGKRALQILTSELSDIRTVVASNRLRKLQDVKIVLDLTHGALRPAQYHPSAEWLESHGYARTLAKCVHIPNTADFASARHHHDQPWDVLHELAHAYHDQVLGFENPEIRRAWERYRDSGHGDSVLHIVGRREKHYALTDHKEFFSEMSEAYFGRNDFFPFNYGELAEAEPEISAMLRRIWGPLAIR
jgi:hypothetical protein